MRLWPPLWWKWLTALKVSLILMLSFSFKLSFKKGVTSSYSKRQGGFISVFSWTPFKTQIPFSYSCRTTPTHLSTPGSVAALRSAEGWAEKLAPTLFPGKCVWAERAHTQAHVCVCVFTHSPTRLHTSDLSAHERNNEQKKLSRLSASRTLSTRLRPWDCISLTRRPQIRNHPLFFLFSRGGGGEMLGLSELIINNQW